MIKIRTGKDYLVALESVAMTDIVLNMFIFFFISFSIIYTFNPDRAQKIDVRLPKAASAAALEGSVKVTLVIDKHGGYYISGEKIKSASLKDALANRLKEDPSIGVILKVDGTARFDSVVRALDVINELNIQKISVAAVKKE